MKDIESVVNDYLELVVDKLKELNRKDMVRFVDMLLEAFENERFIFIFGNGGSAATASHFMCDFLKGVSYKLEKRFKVISLNDNIPTLMAYANDVSYDEIFVEPLKNFVKKDDLVIGISGSGNSPNVIKALEYANNTGAKTVAVCGYTGGKIKEIASHSVHTKVDNMEVSEDIHMVIAHCMKTVFMNKFSV
jgi:D-sedoheptulose 7-phosphate isomerase